MKTSTRSTNYIHRSFERSALLFVSLLLGFFAFLSTTQAVDPPPDGGYPDQNTAEGQDALFSLTTGARNTAIGFQALYSNTTGERNTAAGRGALFSNTSGRFNTAIGAGALISSNGDINTAIGYHALHSNISGTVNTATGAQALNSNTTGFHNVANGYQALNSNTTGFSNVAVGSFALYSNTTGINNTASGRNALLRNTTGSFNIALGASAGGTLTTGDNNIDIGSVGVAGEANTIRIGRQGTQTATYIAGISGTVIAGDTVVVDADGQLGTVASAARFKKEIRPMDKASEAIHALKPVTFRYKQEIDSTGRLQFGLVAEDVEKINPDLVMRDKDGKAYSVRYDQVNAMLLNEFLKEHRKVEEQGAIIAKQQKQIETLSVGLQKVSDELELSKATTHKVSNNQRRF